MISNVIVDYMSGVAAGLGLTKQKDLFAEKSIGEKYVVVDTTDISGEDTIPDIFHSAINIRVAGWGIGPGNTLATKICKRVLTMEGSSFTYGTAPIESYKIMGVTVRNWPVLYDSEESAFTVNIEVSYLMTVV